MRSSTLPPKKGTRRSSSQRYTVRCICTLLAENGYKIFSVAPRFRHHLTDFVAVPYNVVVAPDVLVVRLGTKHHVEIRPYTRMRRNKEVRKLIKPYKKDFCVVRWGPLLPAHKKEGGWLWYIDPQQLNELCTLFNVTVHNDDAPEASIAW